MENVLGTTVQNQPAEDQNLESRFAHIKGWGVDADPENDPQYPMKRWNGHDHKRSHYTRPTLQPVTVEVLKTVERKDLSATFGTSVPPSGISGAIRRFAFQYNEDSYAHWLPLMMADRIGVVEGIVSDLAHGHIPNWYAERGYGAEWKLKRTAFLTRVAVKTAVIAGVIILLSNRKKLMKG